MIRLPRLTLARSMLAVVAIGLLFAAGRSALLEAPESKRRRNLASMHTIEAAMWRSAGAAIRDRGDIGGPKPTYFRSPTGPTGLLADPTRYDPTGRPVSYQYGEYAGHRWLGPDDPMRPERAIRDDLVALCFELAEHHDRMHRKWSFQALIPWHAPEPDPPKPPLIYDPPGDSW